MSLKWDLRETGRETAREMRWRELGGSLKGGHGTVRKNTQDPVENYTWRELKSAKRKKP